MNRIWIRVLAILILPLALLAGCGGSGDGGSDSGYGVIAWPTQGAEVGPQPGQRAPNFRLAAAGGGADIVLAEQAGKPMLINFFATWCTNCREEMAALQDASASGQIAVLGVDLREGNDKVVALMDDLGVTFPVALDSDGDVKQEYRVSNLPATVLVDANGVVVEVVPGPVDPAKIDELVASVTGE